MYDKTCTNPGRIAQSRAEMQLHKIIIELYLEFDTLFREMLFTFSVTGVGVVGGGVRGQGELHSRDPGLELVVIQCFS